MVPVPAVDAAMATILSVKPVQLPSHVTVLYPFLSPRRLDSSVRTALDGITGSVDTFEFQLTRVNQFPRVTYIEVVPTQPFIDLTQSVVSRFPNHPPYGGKFPTIIPHVTLRTVAPLALVEGALKPLLPITTVADQMWLMTRSTSGWSLEQRFLFT